jgi:hypothetical protein
MPFANIHADPEVMLDLGGPISRTESDAKLDRYAAAFSEHGVPVGQWRTPMAASSAMQVSCPVWRRTNGVEYRKQKGCPCGSGRAAKFGSYEARAIPRYARATVVCPG